MLLSLNSRIVDPIPGEDFNLNKKEFNRSLFERHSLQGTPINVLGYDMNETLAPRGSRTLIYALNKRIIYCSVYQIVRHLHHREVMQSNVWTDPTEKCVRGLARKVMREHFVEKYGSIGSYHTVFSKGYEMWMKFATDHLEDCFVYAATSHIVLAHIKDLAELRQYSDQIFGKEIEFENIRLIVSKNPIPLTEQE